MCANFYIIIMIIDIIISASRLTSAKIKGNTKFSASLAVSSLNYVLLDWDPIELSPIWLDSDQYSYYQIVVCQSIEYVLFDTCFRRFDYWNVRIETFI